MDPYNTLVPIRIARLIYGFLNESLSTPEHQELDDWINLSDDNMEIFDEMMDGMHIRRVEDVFAEKEALEEAMIVITYWSLHQAWFYSMEIIKDRCNKGLMTITEKAVLEEKYTSFYKNSFSTQIKTTADLDNMIANSKQMHTMLKELDEECWYKLIMNNCGY